MQRYWKWVAFALAAVLLLPTGALAQSSVTGAITGVVQDEKGGVIPKAKVTVINAATGAKVREVETTDAGTFAAALLPPGTYKIEITASGFSKFLGENIAVRVTETVTVVANMKVGAVTETITVTDAATQINVANATTGQTISSHTVSNLPLSTANFLTLLTLSAGANTEMFDSAALGRGQVTINVNGQRPVNNNYQLEGINANDINLPILDNVALPNPQTVQEFKTQTSMYDASQGRNGGGNIQVALKSGGNEYHGAASFFYRDDALNANSWFFNRDGAARPVLEQKQVSGSLGGPVPLIKDMFFFLNYQRSRATSGSAAFTQFTSTIPVLPSVRTAASLAAIYFPFGIPAGQSINAQALAFLNLPASKCDFGDPTFCIPSLSGTPGIAIPATGNITINRDQFSRSGKGKAEDDQYVVSIDKQLTSKDKITGRWFFSNNKTLQPFGLASTLPFSRALPGSNRFLKVGWTRVLTNSMVNDFRFGFNRFFFSQTPEEPVSLTDIGATRGNSAQYPAAYRISIAGSAAFSLGTGVNDNRGGAFNTFVYGDDFTWTKGRHVFRFGFESSRYQLNRFNNFATRGSVTFGNGAAVDGGGLYGSGNPDGLENLAGFQNFLLGRITGTQGRSGFSTFYFRATDFAAYVQDDWKLHPRLTLNLGLRWEGLSVANEKQNFLTNYLGLGDGTPGPFRVIHPSV
ncbi:MAG: TonB-dependent receptor, partial [Acidobacteria bacterium]|nr:TonB-dependent receptor [Acidobacteriota bacterium]